jgi:hypothetical protein
LPGRVGRQATDSSNALARAKTTENLVSSWAERFLRYLRGVNWPTASVLLHFGTRNRYPILDFRALWSLGNDKRPTSYTFEYWWAYTEACRRLAKEAGVTMRELDRALWQYSKERSMASRTANPDLT